MSKDNDFFDSLFDLDGDGKTTPDEEFISFMIMDQVMKGSEHDYSIEKPAKSSGWIRCTTR